MLKPAISPEEREAEIRRKLGVTAQRIRSRIATMQPSLLDQHQAEIDAYLAKLSSWETGIAPWPPTPDAVLGAAKPWGPRT